MEFLKDLLFVSWFFLPAGAANIAAFVSGKISFLKKYSYPVDGGLKFRGRRILGSHKTIRGFLAGIIVAIIFVTLEVFLYMHIESVRHFIFVDYSKINPVLLGFLLGFGALLGDSIKSFFKRRMAIAPGKSWVPFDQVDYIVGGILLSALYIPLNQFQYALLFIWFLILHPLYNVIGFFLKLKKEPL